MYSNEKSCLDCKIEIAKRRWTQLLLNWLNKCVHPNSPVEELNAESLMGVINKYKEDICLDVDDAILGFDDVESFINYKYPILSLRYLSEEQDLSKKIYMMNTILLFHCCISSIEGIVDSDICVKLEKYEQEMILKFCERLFEMEVTADNVECAIKDSCDAVKPGPRTNRKTDQDQKSLEMTGDQLDFYEPTSSDERSSTNSTASDVSPNESMKTIINALKFESSVTVLPSVIADTLCDEINYSSKSDLDENDLYVSNPKVHIDVEHCKMTCGRRQTEPKELKKRCPVKHSCCAPVPCCGESGRVSTYKKEERCMQDSYEKKMKEEKYNEKKNKEERSKGSCNWKVYLVLAIVVLLLMIIIAILVFMVWVPKDISPFNLIPTAKIEELKMADAQDDGYIKMFGMSTFTCKNGFCEKVYKPTLKHTYASLSRCILLCMGPQLWPYPIGYTYFSKKIVSLTTTKLEYKFQSVPSQAVHLYLAEAFKFFLGDIAKLERYSFDATRMNISHGIMTNKMYIQMDVETDPDPRIRLDTEESYTIKVETFENQVTMKLVSDSFCGMRHALETLSQLILLDQATGNLITLSNIVIKDAPSYKYRGLMIDTGRNYIPVPDIMRTIDAMASCKLNTFHWRISDVTSFPLYLPALPQLFEYGSYDKNSIYTKDDVKNVVKRAEIRGIRVLLEVAAPGPVGRAWSWIPEATCPTKNGNFTCNNVLCLRLSILDSVFDILQIIYSEILEMTKIEDVFHLSDSVFSLANCYYLIEEREGFLEKALERLKLANKGFLPKLPIIWYTTHLTKEFEARAWERFGVQLTEWQPNPSDQFLSRFKVIHSSRWDLSCEVKKQRCNKYRTWQDMYTWKSWRNIEVFTIEGGEAILWTDLVDTGNLDYHLWPRAAAVAERLWSDIALNGSTTSAVYARLDSHRWRMVLRSIQVQPIWPLYCSFSPGVCLEKIKNK